jgi:hypothetical protein
MAGALPISGSAPRAIQTMLAHQGKCDVNARIIAGQLADASSSGTAVKIL